jgi:hypothetical protein
MLDELRPTGNRNRLFTSLENTIMRCPDKSRISKLRKKDEARFVYPQYSSRAAEEGLSSDPTVMGFGEESQDNRLRDDTCPKSHRGASHKIMRGKK